MSYMLLVLALIFAVKVGMAENSSFTSVRQPLMHTCGHRHQRPQLVYHRLRVRMILQQFLCYFVVTDFSFLVCVKMA